MVLTQLAGPGHRVDARKWGGGSIVGLMSTLDPLCRCAPLLKATVLKPNELAVHPTTRAAAYSRRCDGGAAQRSAL
eukprot:scaffold40910_cov72-Phaeocystis_antarctica.AAC.5